MKQINKPEMWEVVQCYKCKTKLKIPSVLDIQSKYLTDCDRHYKLIDQNNLDEDKYEGVF